MKNKTGTVVGFPKIYKSNEVIYIISLYVQYSSNNKKPIIAAKLKRGKKQEQNIIIKECVQDLYTQKYIIKYKSTKDEKLMQASVNVKDNLLEY